MRGIYGRKRRIREWKRGGEGEIRYKREASRLKEEIKMGLTS